MFWLTNQSSLASPVKQHNPEDEDSHIVLLEKRREETSKTQNNTTTSTCCAYHNIIYPLADTRENYIDFPPHFGLSITMIWSSTVSQASRRALTAVTKSTTSAAATVSRQTTTRSMASFPPPRLFDYETITQNLSVTDGLTSVEEAFGALAKKQVDVPMRKL